MSIVEYVPAENGVLLVATMGERAKAKAGGRNGKVSLCAPGRDLAVRLPAGVLRCSDNPDGDTLIDVMMTVAERMSGESLRPEFRPMVDALGDEEGRVLVRYRPYSAFVTPPQHLHRNDQEELLNHWVSASLPTDAVDTPDEG